MKRQITLLYIIIFLNGCYGQKLTDCNYHPYINENLNSQIFNEMFDTLKSNNCGKLELHMMLEQSLKIATNKKDTLLLYEIAKRKILEGQINAVLLTFKEVLDIKKNYPENYRELEHLQDSVFMEKSKSLIGIKVNLELAFQIRKMIKRDQINKVLPYSDVSKADSLGIESRRGDSLNEVLLAEIFIQYGYPGLNIVGYESNTVIVIMSHMSTDFQIKYIHLLVKAKKEKQLNSELNSLIDKILYKDGKKTLYSTTWSNLSPVETDKEKRNELLQMLNLDIEK